MRACESLKFDIVGEDFFAQGAAGDAKHFCCPGLIAASFFEGNFDDRLFYTVNDHGKHIMRLCIAQITEVAFYAFAH